jgi:hypothetical protein
MRRAKPIAKTTTVRYDRLDLVNHAVVIPTPAIAVNVTATEST